MNKARNLRQLNCLARLREMQKKQAIAALAQMQQHLDSATNTLQLAQARYQLALELQRQGRAQGQVLDPSHYTFQLGAVKGVRDLLKYQEIQHADIQKNHLQAQERCTDQYIQSKVIARAVATTQSVVMENILAAEGVALQDQIVRQYLLQERI